MFCGVVFCFWLLFILVFVYIKYSCYLCDVLIIIRCDMTTCNVFAYFLIVGVCLFSSCAKEVDSLDVGSGGFKGRQTEGGAPRDNLVDIPSETLAWDESYHPLPIASSRGVAPRSLFYPAGGINESTELAVVNSRCHIGKIFPAKALQELTFRDAPLSGNLAEDITITFMFPSYYSKTIRPNVSTFKRALDEALTQPRFSGEQFRSFEYDYRSFQKYDELKLAFGADVNVASIFKLNTNVNTTRIRARSGLMARVCQRYFDVVMDYSEDGNIFRNNDDLSKFLSYDPVYISTVTYGRMAIIAIESEYSYEHLKAAFKATLSVGKLGATLSLDPEHKKIMDEATIRLFVWGGRGADAPKLMEGASELFGFVSNGGEFTATSHGQLIYCTASYASDNGLFSTKFRVAE